MQSKDFDTVRSDVLVIGGGGAGLMAAIRARAKGADVTFVSKSRVGYGNNTYISKAAVSAASGRFDLQDDPTAHIKDAVLSGCFINDQRILERIAKEVRPQIGFLEDCGVRFHRSGPDLVILQAPGHSRPRNIRPHNQTGSGYTIPLRAHALKVGVRFIEDVMITRLLAPSRRFSGATGLTPEGAILRLQARACVLATGGFAQIYLKTNNAAGTTGDGLALAYELGLPLRDMEFIQFYPTALGDLGRPMLLYEGFVFRAGAVLRNSAGENVAAKHGLSDPSSLTRDRLTRAVMTEILGGLSVEGGVVMDFSAVPLEKITPLRHLLPAGWTPEQRKIIVSPTTHFCMGGVMTDENGKTEVSGLFAAGEICGGAHGANRLGGNALAEVFSMGSIVGEQAADFAGKVTSNQPLEKEIADERARLKPRMAGEKEPLRELRRRLKVLVWENAGIIRNGPGLEKSLAGIQSIRALLPKIRVDNAREMIRAIELENMLRVGEMVTRAALLRTESRGAHYRSDYPEQDNKNWLKNIVIRKEGAGMRLEPVPVSFPLLAPDEGEKKRGH